MTAAAQPLDEETLRAAHATLTRILGAIEEYVYTGEFLPDDGYEVVFAGPCRDQFLGLSVEEARTAVWRYYVHPDDIELFDTAHDGARRDGRLDVQYRLIGADGVLRWVRDRGRVRSEGDRCFLDGSILDVTEVHTARQELLAARREADRLANTDHLTGLANRRRLPELLQPPAIAGGLVVVDLDHFKTINDQHGHAVGDAVLIAVADRLRGAVREADEIVRMGGEEFLLVLNGVGDRANLARIAETIRATLQTEPIRTGDLSVSVTASLGAAYVAAGTRDSERCLRDADNALYRAKAAGRDRVELA